MAHRRLEALVKAAVAVAAVGLLLLAGTILGARGGEDAGSVPSAEERRGAVEAVRSFLSLGSHFKGSGGDDRFAERLPASRELVEELRRELDFAEHLGTVQEARIVRLDVAEVRRRSPDRIEVDVNEYRRTQTTAVEGEGSALRNDVVRTRFSVVRLPGGWTVVDREHAPLMLPPARGG